MLGMEDGKAVLDGGREGLAGGITPARFGECGGSYSVPVNGVRELRLALLFLGGVLLDMLFRDDYKRCQLQVER